MAKVIGGATFPQDAFDREQKKYLGSLKIHSTQKEIDGEPDEFRIMLRMRITHDLIKEILSYGHDVEVIAPKSLRNEMKKIFAKTLIYYSK